MEVLGQTKYRKTRLVGKGKHGEVWEAIDLHSGGTVAVKEIARSLLDQQGVSDYFAEAKAMEASGHHNNVVLIRYACNCPAEQKIGLVMPLYPKGSLDQRIASGPLSLREVIRTALAWLNGLHQVHLARYIHYDIKPSNILFSDGDVAMVADFGQSRMIRPGGTAELPGLYPDSVPPEFFTGAVGTIETDIYHAGVTLFRAANGNPFFKAQVPTNIVNLERMTLDGTFPDRDSFLPHVPNALRAVIRKAISVDPSQRYSSATDLQDAVANVAMDLDWQVTLRGDGSGTWKAPRKERSDLVVELEPDGNKWSVRQYVDNGVTRRGRKVADWEFALTHKQAMQSLKRTFRSLG
jgi:eukaryotic-like serine/threonine-protein kinase